MTDNENKEVKKPAGTAKKSGAKKEPAKKAELDALKAKLEKAEAELAKVNDLLLRWYEEAIAAHPEAWLWAYKRWRYIPLGADPSPFPWYALPPEGDPWLAPEWQKFLDAKRKRPPC